MKNKQFKKVICGVLNKHGEEYEFSSIITNQEPYLAVKGGYTLRNRGYPVSMKRALIKAKSFDNFMKTGKPCIENLYADINFVSSREHARGLLLSGEVLYLEDIMFEYKEGDYSIEDKLDVIETLTGCWDRVAY